MNNVFPVKEECGKIQVSSDWEAEWYMLTKRLEIAWLSIEGIQAWIITSGRQRQMGTVAPNLSIWTPQNSHEETHIGSKLLVLPREAQRWAFPVPSQKEHGSTWTPTTELQFQHGSSCRLYVPRYVATKASASPSKSPFLDFRQLWVGAHCLIVQTNHAHSTFVWTWDQGPGWQRDCRSLPVPSQRHLLLSTWHWLMCAQPQLDASGLRKVQGFSRQLFPLLSFAPQGAATCAMSPSCTVSAPSSARPSRMAQVSFSVFFYG